MLKSLKFAGAVLVTLLFVVPGYGQSDSTKAADVEKVSDTSVAGSTTNQSSLIVAYYFHGNTRCATCRKLEAYSKEAVAQGFATMLQDSSMEWRVINFDDEANQHFLKDYGLFSQAVVVSEVIGGKERRWKNLDQIWKLVGEKEKFIAYVQIETKSFISGDTK